MDSTTLPLRSPGTWTDIQGLGNLRRAAREDSKAALPAVARQFESMFTQMLIKSMRDASFGGGILDSRQSKQWRDMFDKQIALSLANDGSGMGIAAMLTRQLGGGDKAAASAGASTAATTALTPDLRSARTVDASRSGTRAQPVSSAADLLDRALQFAAASGRQAITTATDLAASGPAGFVRALAPYARAAAAKLGVSVRTVLAQAALETGWGKHMPQQSGGGDSFNLFGIKAGDDWQGASVTSTTQEFENGAPASRSADFRAYAGPPQSFADYVGLLTGNPRYAAALGRGDDVAGFAQALQRAGYATDPDYAAKLTAIAGSDTMRQALASLKNSLAPPTPEL